MSYVNDSPRDPRPRKTARPSAHRESNTRRLHDPGLRDPAKATDLAGMPTPAERHERFDSGLERESVIHVDSGKSVRLTTPIRRPSGVLTMAVRRSCFASFSAS